MVRWSPSSEPAVGWVAIGDQAYGILFACGPLAVGGIACGAISAGGIAFGGLAIGLVPVGGAAIGWLATGGMAFGVFAIGGCAAAWTAAMGGISAARHYAVGGIAVAEQANTELALEFVHKQPFFQITEQLMAHSWIWLALVALSFLPMIWAWHKASHAQE